MKTIESGPMTASWHYAEGRIYLEMSAPTTGWVAVGFNQSDQLSGAYLLMGRVRGQQAEVVEHFTSAPGSYSPWQH
ncbi:MAG: hypothetical protein HC842_05730 [Cytophagales bacterium]|nr:hypothetical protein [Cytophagales bacterium]